MASELAGGERFVVEVEGDGFLLTSPDGGQIHSDRHNVLGAIGHRLGLLDKDHVLVRRDELPEGYYDQGALRPVGNVSMDEITEWVEVQVFAVWEEGTGRTKPLLIRPEAVVSVGALQRGGWRDIELGSGPPMAVVWTPEVAKALGLGGEIEKRYNKAASRVLAAEEEVEKKQGGWRVEVRRYPVGEPAKEKEGEQASRPLPPPEADVEGAFQDLSSDLLSYQRSVAQLRLAAKKFVNPRGRFEDLRQEIDEILRRKYPATEELLSCPPQAVVEENLGKLGLDPEKLRQELRKHRERWATCPPRPPEADKPLQSREFLAFMAKANERRAQAGREPYQFTVDGMVAAVNDHYDTLHKAPDPCPPPASPPSAEPAGETSGGERCTAEGACKPRRLFLETFGGSRLTHAGENVEGIGPFSHCPWCGEKLGGEGAGSDSEARALLKKLVRIDDALESGETLVSNQGQAMDGYTALAEFRSIARKARELPGGEG